MGAPSWLPRVTVLLAVGVWAAACAGTPTPPSPTATAAPPPTAVVNGPTPTPAAEATPTETAPTEAPTDAPTEAPTELTPTATEPTPTEAPTEAPTTAPDNVPTGSGDSGDANGECSNVLAFFEDVTVPDGSPVRQGESFTKTWRVRNEGTCTWRGYALIFVGGEQMNAAPILPLDFAVAPREITDISVELTAPKRGGEYVGQWQLQDSTGKRFGVSPGSNGTLYTQISVNFSGNEISVANPPVSLPASPAIGACGTSGNAGFESAVLQRFNAARAQAGLGPLSLAGELYNAAALHSVDMACAGYIGHSGTDGSSPKSRVQAQGFANWNAAVENVYGWSDATPDTAFDWWWNSAIHHAAIMNPNHSLVGISYVLDPGTNMGYFTAVFARP